jgi:lantibiotic modifying enzyme
MKSGDENIRDFPSQFYDWFGFFIIFICSQKSNMSNSLGSFYRIEINNTMRSTEVAKNLYIIHQYPFFPVRKATQDLLIFDRSSDTATCHCFFCYGRMRAVLFL